MYAKHISATVSHSALMGHSQAARHWKSSTSMEDRDAVRAPVAAAQPAPAAGFFAGTAAGSFPAASGPACRSGRCDVLRMKLTGAERRLLPLSDPAQQRPAWLAHSALVCSDAYARAAHQHCLPAGQNDPQVHSPGGMHPVTLHTTCNLSTTSS